MRPTPTSEARGGGAITLQPQRSAVAGDVLGKPPAVRPRQAIFMAPQHLKKPAIFARPYYCWPEKYRRF
nr:unnamed protein product [Digitaria exilis]